MLTCTLVIMQEELLSNKHKVLANIKELERKQPLACDRAKPRSENEKRTTGTEHALLECVLLAM